MWIQGGLGVFPIKRLRMNLGQIAVIVATGDLKKNLGPSLRHQGGRGRPFYPPPPPKSGPPLCRDDIHGRVEVVHPFEAEGVTGQLLLPRHAPVRVWGAGRGAHGGTGHGGTSLTDRPSPQSQG